MYESWEDVRVFVSSTFRDMQAERNWLQSVVFPELRERCAGRELHLFEVDLRWGLPEDQVEQGKTLSLCLDEIDSCRPFFLGLLGDRYGESPSDIPEEALASYGWLRDYSDRSYTELEIIHGVLNDPAMAHKAVFLFRQLEAGPGLPSDYRAENDDSAAKLADLKARIADSRLPAFRYQCRWQDGVVGLEQFGQMVLEELWNLINAEYPIQEQQQNADNRISEKEIARLTKHFFGRSIELERISRYVVETSREPLIIAGAAGCGKSSLLAEWVRQRNTSHPEQVLLVHFAGKGGNCTSHFDVLRRFGRELASRLGLLNILPAQDRELPLAFSKMLDEAILKTHEPIILVLDALEELTLQLSIVGLPLFLPAYARPGVKVIASAQSNKLQRELELFYPQWLLLDPLNQSDRTELVHSFLGDYGKVLSPQQLTDLLEPARDKNPAYLKAVLEELRVRGDVRTQPDFVKQLPTTLEGLFYYVIDCLDADFRGVFPVSDAIAYLAASKAGLSENELLQLIEGQVPPLYWARIRRRLDAFLVQRGAILDLASNALWEVAESRISNLAEYRVRLASYLSTQTIARRVDEGLWQLARANAWEQLQEELTALPVVNWFSGKQAWQEWFDYWDQIPGWNNVFAHLLEAVDSQSTRDDSLKLVMLGLEAMLSSDDWRSQASPLCQKAFILLEAGDNSPSERQADDYLTLGSYAEKLEELDTALLCFKKAWSVAHALGMGPIVISPYYGALSRCREEVEARDIRRQVLVEACSKAESLAPGMTADQIAEQAWEMLDANEPQEAYRLFKTAVALQEATGDCHSRSFADKLDGLSQAAMQIGQGEEGIAALRTAQLLRSRLSRGDSTY